MIYLTGDGIVSKHAHAPMFYELRNVVVEASRDLGPWTGEFPPHEFELTLLDERHERETVYLGRDWIRVGWRVAPLNGRISEDRWRDFHAMRASPGTFPADQLDAELARQHCVQ